MPKQGFIKTKEEIAIIREGGKRLARILSTLRDAIKPGVTTRELDQLAEKLMRDDGDEPAFLNYTPEGSPHAYPGTLCISVNDEIVHGIGGDRVLKEGDIVGIDTGVKHKGFFTDSALTVPVGQIDDTAKKIIAVTDGALTVGIATARAGNTVGDIGYAIEKYVKEHGFVVVEELGGHGVGYHQHEDPHISNYGDRGQGMRLKQGMVLALEPIVNEGTRYIKLMPDGHTYATKDGKRSAHFEHTILITDGAPEVLTKRE
ncbi:MAG: type I methionyl aminopeptidase [Patescibacteria group bacterium]